MSVSVIVPAFNAEQVIERAIRSALGQTRPPDEIIIVDDASRDGTCALVARLSESAPSLRLIRAKRNGGPARARNLGFDAARSDWIALLDADDAWKPERLEQLVAVGEAANADVVADNFILYDAHADREGRTAFPSSGEVTSLTALDLFAKDMPEKRGAHFSGLLKPLFRRRFLDAHAIRYDESLRYGEDFKLLAEILLSGAKAMLTARAFYIYTARAGEFSGQSNPASQSTPRFDLLLATNQDLEAKYRDQITPALQATIRERGARLRTIHLSNVARQYRRSGKLLRYMGYVAAHPSLARLLLKRTARRLIAR